MRLSNQEPLYIWVSDIFSTAQEKGYTARYHVTYPQSHAHQSMYIPPSTKIEWSKITAMCLHMYGNTPSILLMDIC